MTYTLEQAHEELCQFLGVTSLKNRMDLLIEYYKAQISRINTRQLVDAIREQKLKAS